MQDARKLLSVGRAFRTLVTQKGHLQIRSSIKFPYDKELELLHQPEISKQVYPYIEDMVRSIAWLADKLLRPRYDVLRGDPRFEKKVPEMKKTMQRLGCIRKDMQELLPKGYDVGTATDRCEVRASPPEIALELLAQTVQAERESYPRTSDECKSYRELTRAPLFSLWERRKVFGVVRNPKRLKKVLREWVVYYKKHDVTFREARCHFGCVRYRSTLEDVHHYPLATVTSFFANVHVIKFSAIPML